MSVVYAAVGRRLGYPIRLVKAKGQEFTHLFARWEEPGNCFNIEATAEGLRCPPDSYYRTGRFQIDSDTEKMGCFLLSMTPRQELASFFMERGFCWLSKRHRFAANSFAWASGLAIGNRLYENTLNSTLNSWQKEVDRQKPDGFPKLVIEGAARRFPSSLPLKLERDICGLEATENLVNGSGLIDFFRENRRMPDWVLAKFSSEGNCEISLRMGLYEEF